MPHASGLPRMITEFGYRGRRRVASMEPRFASPRSLQKYLVNSAESSPSGGPRFEASSCDPCLYFVLRKSGGAVGATTTQIDDISGCGEPGLQLKARRFLEKRFGKLKVQDESFVNVGIELAQGRNFSVTLARADFTKNLK